VRMSYWPELEKVIPPGPVCKFEGKPIFAAAPTATGPSIGVVKIHGRLVQLGADAPSSFQDLVNGGRFAAGPIHITVAPLAGESPEEVDGGHRWPANMMFELEQGLTVGYRGWYSCRQSRQSPASRESKFGSGN
jgi:hypothetical protein